MNLFFALALILIVGILSNQITKKFKIPTIIGYLLAGILIGPYCFNLIHMEEVTALSSFSTLALTIISFTIGAEFKISFIKKIGGKPLIIALMSALLTLILVTSVLTFAGCDFPLALLFGAIASSTAPPAVMIIVKEYKAKGKLTDMILSVIALDDVISILLFGFSLVIVESTLKSRVDFVTVLEPFREILFSLLLGGFFGVLLGRVRNLLHNNVSEISILTLGFLFLMIGVSEWLEISSLLVAMIMGFSFINTSQRNTVRDVIHLTDTITPTLYILFFILSGASLNLTLIPKIGLFGILFFIMRTIGKIGGAILGGFFSRTDFQLTKSLGPCLLSETGIAVGLALLAGESFPMYREELQTVTIACSFLFDLVSPFIVRFVLKKKGEISPKKKKHFFQVKKMNDR